MDSKESDREIFDFYRRKTIAMEKLKIDVFCDENRRQMAMGEHMMQTESVIALNNIV